MEPTPFALLLLIALAAWIALDVGKRGSLLRHLEHELATHLPVFSAETVRGKEAEFIRERLRRKRARALLFLLVALPVFVTVAWWATL